MNRLFVLTVLLAVAACGGTPDKAAPDVTADVAQAPATPAKPKITAVELLGQPGVWVLTHLGQPAFIRQERSANIWQYKTATCVLNVFLYSDQAGDDHKVLHFDARALDGSNTNRDQCLSTVQD